MSIENPNDLLAKERIRKAYKHHYKTFFDILQHNVTQRESQMKYSLHKVLTAIDLFGRINTSRINQVSNLNWTSLTRSTTILLEKKILTVEQHNDKKNNEKIYSIHRTRAIIYLDHIFNHKQKYKNWKKRTKRYDYFATLDSKFPINFYNWWIFFSPRMQKKLGINKEFCLVRELSEDEIIVILKYYNDGNYCRYCQSDTEKLSLPKDREFFYLTELVRKDEDSEICEICHCEQQYNDRGDPRIKKKRKEYRLGTD